MKSDYDIIVAGSGPVGLMAALLLGREGFRVLLAGPEANVSDRRTTALMKPSLNFLERLDVLDAVRTQAAPLRVMRIVDATQRLLRSPVVTFRAAEIGEAEFGLNIPNTHLLTVLSEAVGSLQNVTWRKALISGWNLREEEIEGRFEGDDAASAKLAVAADGRMSPAREAAGISVRSKKSRQSALVLTFAHTRPHDDISTEFHTEDGPFTQVPLPGDRSSLVWVVRPERAAELSALDDAVLARLIEERMQSMLGRIEIEAGRQVYPLSSALPDRFAAQRVALVGEAAHIFPPIGAQGLNLGIRDLESLIGVILAGYLGDPGGPDSLAAYDRSRRPDILARSSAVNLLNRSLLSDMLPVQFARAGGLALLDAMPPLRTLFMREGLRTGSGFGSLFAASGK